MPNRVLRDWTTSETIDKLSQGAEVFFTRLIMKADDFGNYTANTKLLKAALFPLKNYSEFEINDWLSECINAGIILKYTAESKDFINIPNFGQRLRAMKSHFPAISQTNDGHVSVSGRLETKRNEGETETKEKGSIVYDLQSNPSGLSIVIKESGLIAVRIFKQSFEKYMNGTFAQYYEQQKMSISSPPPIEDFFKTRNGDIFDSPQHVWSSFKKLWITPKAYQKPAQRNPGKIQ
jgi:hypothetical protein